MDLGHRFDGPTFDAESEAKSRSSIYRRDDGDLGC
jgi:hypothetical protein